MTLAERTEKARAEHECPRPRCQAPAGKPCRSHIPIYTPLGFDHPLYGREMKNVHPERLALVTEEES
jgi:hypothetical protein